MKLRKLFSFYRYLMFGLVIFGCSLLCLKALAQAGSWSNPVNISESAGNSSFPSLTVDAFGNVHLVWIEEIGPDEVVVMYTSLNENGWSDPIDIFASSSVDPIRDVQLLGDSSGNLHIFLYWQGIRYSRADAMEAGSARSWLSPEMLVQPYYALTSPYATIAPDDSIHLVYAIQTGSGSGLYAIQSVDYGEIWSDPIGVYISPSATQAIDKAVMAVDGAGTQHVVWGETNYPETFPPVGIRYTSSADGQVWKEPDSLADGPYAEPAILAAEDSSLHVVWSGTATARYKFHSWSKDSGNTWTDPWRNEDLGGIQGSPALCADSLDRIYWLQVGTIFSLPDSDLVNNDGLLENIFQERNWSSGAILLTGSVEQQNLANVTAVIAQGNQLHAALMNPLSIDNGSYQFEIFYLYKSLDAPPITITLQPTTNTPVLPEPTPTTLFKSALNSSPTPRFETNPAPAISNWTSVLAGLLPAAALVVIVTAAIRRRK